MVLNMWCQILDSRGTLMRSFAPYHMLHRGTISYGIGSYEGPPSWFCVLPRQFRHVVTVWRAQKYDAMSVEHHLL